MDVLSRLEGKLGQILTDQNIYLSEEQLRYVSYGLTGVVVLLPLVPFFMRGRNGRITKPKRKKKRTPAQQAKHKSKKDIEGVRERAALILPEIEKYKLGKAGVDSVEYHYRYISETLLKLLLELDGVEHFGEESLRQQRKDAIKYIQGILKDLDGIRSAKNGESEEDKTENQVPDEKTKQGKSGKGKKGKAKNKK